MAFHIAPSVSTHEDVRVDAQALYATIGAAALGIADLFNARVELGSPSLFGHLHFLAVQYTVDGVGTTRIAVSALLKDVTLVAQYAQEQSDLDLPPYCAVAKVLFFVLFVGCWFTTRAAGGS